MILTAVDLRGLTELPASSKQQSLLVSVVSSVSCELAVGWLSSCVLFCSAASAVVILISHQSPHIPPLPVAIILSVS